MTRPIIHNRPQRILITGDRNWSNSDMIAATFHEHHLVPSDVIIHGDARGADRMGAEIARNEFHISESHILAFPADWNQYGRSAGPIRNQQMLTEGKPTLVLAFHDNIHNSKGTKDMIIRALEADVTVYFNGLAFHAGGIW